MPKKAKGGSKSRCKGGKEKDGNPREPLKAQITEDFKEPQVLPQERIAKVKPFWATVPQEECLKLLSIPVSELKQRAAEVGARQRREQAAEQAARVAVGLAPLVYNPTVDEVVSVGIQRLQQSRTWKLWRWPLAAKEFLDAKEFRLCIEEESLDEKLRHLLPHNERSPIEKAAEQALRLRMTELLKRADEPRRQLQVAQRNMRRMHPGSPEPLQDPVRSCNLKQIRLILQALAKEQDYLARTFLDPVTAAICEWVPEHMHEILRMELRYDDIEKLPASILARTAYWLRGMVDSLTKPRGEPKEAEQEAEEEARDVDHFILNEDDCLQVNPKWLQLLQERLLDKDGHARKAEAGEDPHNVGLSLEYIFGNFVSMDERARNSEQLCLGPLPPSAVQAHKFLVAALEDMHNKKTFHRKAKELLKEILQIRSEAAKLSNTNDTRPNPTASPPRTLPGPLLVREMLLTHAKIKELSYYTIIGETELQELKRKLHQGERRSDRLKRDMEDVKTQPGGLEGTVPTAAKKQRHRAQLADDASREQLKVQAAFRKHGEHMQDICDQRQRKEYDKALVEHEIWRLQEWLTDLMTMASIHTATSRHLCEDSAVLDMRRQLYSEDHDIDFVKCTQVQIVDIEERIGEGRAVLLHLQNQLMKVACDDPGAAIGMQLALPILQERLEGRAMAFADEKAREIIEMKEDAAERELVERERRQKLKQKARDKERTAKERAAAQREASERDARSRQEAEAMRQKEEAAAAAVERNRAKERRLEKELADEAGMERQRQQPLKDQNGSWRLHMEQLQEQQLLSQPAIEEPETDQGFARRPSAASSGPRGQQAENKAANPACSVRACKNRAKDLAAPDIVLGHPQQPSQQSAEPAQDACSHAVGGAQAALSADRAPECVTPKKAEQGLRLRSVPLSPLPEPAQEAPAATSGLQDKPGLLLPPVLHAARHDVPSQELSQPRNASRAAQASNAAANAEQSGVEEQLGELPAHSLQPKSQKLRPQPRARQAEACSGAPSSCMPAAVPGDELCPDDECVICLDAQRCILLAPCGHMPYCVECAEQLCGPNGMQALARGQVCPLCREAVLATVYKTFY